MGDNIVIKPDGEEVCRITPHWVDYPKHNKDPRVYVGPPSIDIPKKKWRLDIGNGTVCIYSPTAPCRLHRILQRWVLGFKWERLK